MITMPYQHTDDYEPIEATYIKHEDSVDYIDLAEKLKTEKFHNKKLADELETINNNLKITTQDLEGVKKFNRKLEQDVQYYKIQISNLKNINIKFIRTINNLQSYRGYVSQLLTKRTRTNQKIQRLVKELKNMQTMLRKKNDVINQKTRAYEIAKLQTAHMIKETYGI